jgi:hypothetical protein
LNASQVCITTLTRNIPQAVKFGYVCGVHRESLEYKVPTKNDFKKAADIAEQIFAQCVQQNKLSRAMTPAEVDKMFLADVNKDGRLNEEVRRSHRLFMCVFVSVCI